MVHTIEGFTVVDEGKVNFLLHSIRFIDNSPTVRDVITSSSTFLEASLFLRELIEEERLKSFLENFKHHLTGMR